MFYTYILQSTIDSSFYIGYSQNPQERLLKHNSSNKGYTATRKPWVLVHIEQFSSKTQAIKREKELKRMKSKVYILKLIEEDKNG